MSVSLVLAPVVIASWPAITAAVAGAAAAMGLAVKGNVKTVAENRQTTSTQTRERQVEVVMADSEVLTENVATGQEIIVTKGNLEIRVRRDERGRCSVCAKGIGHTEAELKQIAEEFTQRMTQCYMYHRVVSELKNKGFQIVNEERMADEGVRINVRRWEG